MTIKELIDKLMNFPLETEVIKTYSVPDEDGEEWTIEDGPFPLFYNGRVEI